MKVEKNKTTVIAYVLTLSESEFSTLRKFIGRTSPNNRKELADLNDEENDIISKIYLDIEGK